MAGSAYIPGMSKPRLSLCPDRPNCVCSLETRSSHRVEPLPLTRPPAEAVKAVRDALDGLPRCRIVDEQADYIHAVVTSRLFRFRDDVEIWIDTEGESVHFRSASRIGYSDLGVNRRRIEKLAKELTGKV